MRRRTTVQALQHHAQALCGLRLEIPGRRGRALWYPVLGGPCIVHLPAHRHDLFSIIRPQCNLVLSVVCDDDVLGHLHVAPALGHGSCPRLPVAATPIPRVVGPLAVTASSHPFGGAAWQLQPQNLAAHGYVEEEYLVSGKANVYDWSADNKAVVPTEALMPVKP